MLNLGKILGSFNKTLSQLEKFQNQCDMEANANEKVINNLTERNVHLTSEANKAETVAKNIRNILEG